MSARPIRETQPVRITTSFIRQHLARVTPLVMLLLAVCFPGTLVAQTVAYNYARGVNFAAYKTFEWVSADCGGAADPDIDSNIRRVIQQEFSKRGVLEVASGADLLIGYQVSDRREKDIQMCEVGGIQDYGPGWDDQSNYGHKYGYDFRAPAYMSTSTGATLSVGSLVIDAYDGRHKDLVWRGRVSKAVTFAGSESREQKDLQRAVARLLDAYRARVSNSLGR